MIYPPSLVCLAEFPKSSYVPPKVFIHLSDMGNKSGVVLKKLILICYSSLLNGVNARDIVLEMNSVQIKNIASFSS
ncbi:MAG: hypothetical protein A3K77_02620 [Euryarchaeota archaeon RBG_13_31_8]|nr:MAG: hypothetical protein A3K77_02620 [Euryarchaeota archaeon RBG_13_31_8]